MAKPYLISKAHFILYVRDQSASSTFYQYVLGEPPTLQAPGMTEFTIGNATIIGLMPESGIARLLGFTAEELSPQGVRGEIYLVVADPQAYHQRALEAGARELSALAPRDWGAQVAYSLDLNGYILAFASLA